MDPFSPNYKMFCCHGEPQTLSHQKSDVIFLLTRLKGKNIFGLYLIHLNCIILDLDGILGFQEGLDFLVLILGHPTPKALTIILARSLRRSVEMENLGFLENSRICKMRKNDSPGTLYRKRNPVGTSPLEIQKRRQRVMSRTNLAQIQMKPPNRWIRIASFKRTLYTETSRTRLEQFKRCLTFRGGKKGVRRGNYHIEILLSPMEQKKRTSRSYCRGKSPRLYTRPWALSEDINRSKNKQVIMKYSQTKFRKKRENEWLFKEYILLGLNEYGSKYI